MNILAVGDIVGNSGVNKLKAELQDIKNKYNIDFVIVNGENAAEGMGLTIKNFKDIISAGTDCITMGNHTWGKKEIFQIIDEPQLLRPINYPEGVCGKGYNVFSCNGKKIAVINAMGRAEINIQTENPFIQVKKVVDELKNKVDMIFLDFHAEATAEKQAMGYFLDGEITAMFGTHTHVQTADEKILEKGTGYITDIGMTGPKNSILGMDRDAALKRFLTALPEKYKIADGETMLNACIFKLDDNTNKVIQIERIVK